MPAVVEFGLKGARTLFGGDGRATNMSEAALLAEIERAIVFYEKATGHAATRTRQMIDMYGGIEALSRLIVSPDLQQGFKVLRDNGQLDKTFESVVVSFRHLFRPEVVQSAEWRLANAAKLL